MSTISIFPPLWCRSSLLPYQCPATAPRPRSCNRRGPRPLPAPPGGHGAPHPHQRLLRAFLQPAEHLVWRRHAGRRGGAQPDPQGTSHPYGVHTGGRLNLSGQPVYFLAIFYPGLFCLRISNIRDVLEPNTTSFRYRYVVVLVTSHLALVCRVYVHFPGRFYSLGE